jgi:membrane protease YdiL (CAAX protease family)
MSAEAVRDPARVSIGIRVMMLQFLITLALALGIGALSGGPSLRDRLFQGEPWPQQCAWGVVVGLLVSIPTLLLVVRVRRFRPFRNQLVEFLAGADLGGLNPLWFSLCAGIGEEALFRGALQPLLGIVVTSLIFTALHYQTGGFRSMNRMKALYAGIVFLASLLLGALCVQRGLIAAMVVHTVIDTAVLMTFRKLRG